MMTTVTITRDLKTPDSRRRAVLDGLLKTLDVAVGLVALTSGVFALVAVPESIAREVSLPGLIIFWGVLLVLGGLCATLGRLTGIWILETVGIMGMTFGALIYIVVVSSAITHGFGVAVALCFILIALLAMARRYVELQIFLTEPEEPGAIRRMLDLFKIRTP